MTPLAIPVLILAAGASTRMRGRDKLQEDVREGYPLLLDRVDMALGTGQPVLVTLPPRETSPDRWRLIEERPVAVVGVPDAAEGMARSIACGVDALPEGAVGVLILPSDMPNITTQDIKHMIAEFDGERILRATTADGVHGHPVLFPSRDFSVLRSLEGDAGAKSVLDANEDRLKPVPLPHDHARLDLDTPEDWASWRQEAGAPHTP
ncbi:nucleotidyltransferase family protein [Maritimibacter dapengensis]|uniref:Nucleotidyltransferase family protein n=1 Tax=Maritimibacter dapengensis TaxID=2836868 RepID=A0ABS6T2K6_9RHOB|nr:nucleotidyltransferase family protein [Maritimibacter dapengensis]MBV7379349.1 nucleotidyltransferase family protein [Maritimibacter dapengensis]